MRLQVCEALARDAGVTVDEVYGTIEKLQVWEGGHVALEPVVCRPK